MDVEKDKDCKVYETVSDFVAVSPLPPEQRAAPTGSVMSLMSKNEDLKPLTVVFNNNEMRAYKGDKVFLRPESYTAPYMGMVYQVDGVKFVLVPKNMIIVVFRDEAGWY